MRAIQHTGRNCSAIAWLLICFLIILSPPVSYSQQPADTTTIQPADAPAPQPASTNDSVPAATEQPAVEIITKDTTQQATASEQPQQPETPVETTPPAPLDVGYAAVADDTIGMSFYKYKAVHNADDVFSNILKIENKTSQRIAGTVEISVPDGWKLLSPAKKRVSVSAGKSSYIPVRIIVSKRSKGDVGYILQAAFRSLEPYKETKKELTLISNSYVSLPKVSDWRITAPRKMINITQMNETEAFSLHFENRGNSDELVRLQINAGEKLNMFGAKEGIYISEIEMAPYTDTVLTYSVKYIGQDKEDDYMGWKGASININASTKEKKIATTIWFKFLKSSYTNELNLNLFPLNVELTVRNLLAAKYPTFDLGVWGNILLPKNRAIEYYIRNSNMASTPKVNTGSDYLHYLWSSTLMSVGYTTKNAGIFLGDNSGMGNVGSMVFGGRGIGGYYKFKKSQIGASVGKNIISPLYGASLGYNFSISTVGISTGLSYTIDEVSKINNAVGLLGVNFTIMRKHSFNTSFSINREQHNYNDSTFKLNDTLFIKTVFPDTAIIGYSASLGYSTRINKLSVQLYGYYASEYSWPARGILNVNANLNYPFTQSFTSAFNFARTEQNPSYFNTTGNRFRTYFLITDHYNLTFSKRINPKFSFHGGGTVSRSVTEKYDPTSKKQLPFGSISGNIDLRLKYNRDRYTSLSPYLNFGYSQITLSADSAFGIKKEKLDPFREPFFNAQAGFYVRMRYWGVNFSYFYGAYSLFSQISYIYNQEPTKTIRIMPYYEKFFLNETFKVVANASYMYMIQNRTQMINLSFRLEYFVKKGWRFHSNINFSSYSRYDKETAYELSNKTFYFDIGVRKNFNIPQPRVKYYDLKVICFKDINGNRSRDDNEAGFDYVLVKINRDESDTDRVGIFRYVELITDPFGEISYFNIPEGKYKITFTPLKNLKDYHLENKEEIPVVISENTTIYVPFIKSNKISGKIVMLRDEFSQLGAISLGEVRITAFDTLGNQYSSLTEKDGSFTLYVPNTGLTKVRTYNIFGDNVTLEQDEFIIDFNGFKEFEVVFKFRENPRTIKMNGTPGIPESPTLRGRTEPAGTVTPPETGTTTPPAGTTTLPAGTTIPPAGTITPPAGTTTIPPAGGTTQLPPTTGTQPPEESGVVVPQAQGQSITWEEVNYYIIIGSYTDLINAESFVATVADKSNLLIIQPAPGTYRVVYGYRTDQEARTDLPQKKALYPSSWMQQKR